MTFKFLGSKFRWYEEHEGLRNNLLVSVAFLLKEDWENLEWLVKDSNKLALGIRKPFFAAEMVNLSGEGVSHAKLC